MQAGDMVKVIKKGDEHFNKIGTVLIVHEPLDEVRKKFGVPGDFDIEVKFIDGAVTFKAYDTVWIFCPHCRRYKKGAFSSKCDTCQYNLFKFSDNRDSKHVRGGKEK